MFTTVVTDSPDMVAIRRANCFDNNGLADRCNSSSTPRMAFFGVMLILFSQSQIPADFDQIWWLSIVAAVMSFTYYKIAFAYSYSYSKILIEIQDTIKAPPSSESNEMQKTSGLRVARTAIFYMLCNTTPYMILLYGLVQVILFSMLSCACLALAEYMCTWITMLPPACRIGTRYPRSSSSAPTPTTGAFKGSGMRIGRARDALPAGGSHGIPAFARAGDCSLLPHKCDWFRIMGSTVINTDESCVISAAVMCMEAQYRRLNENYHGANSCVLKVMAEAVESLKDMCEERGSWEPNVGAPTVEGVLAVIRSWKQGLPTVHGNISLRLKSYVSFQVSKLSPLEVTSMLQKIGPMVGVLYTDREYFRSAVYRGYKAFPANHAVTCTGFRYVDGELFIIIMDNVQCEGPFRFVLYEAFEEFHVLTIVDASS